MRWAGATGEAGQADLGHLGASGGGGLVGAWRPAGGGCTYDSSRGSNEAASRSLVVARERMRSIER